MGWFCRRPLVVVCTVALLVASSAYAQDQPPESESSNPGESLATKYSEVVRAQRALMSLLSQAFGADHGLNEMRTEFEKAQKKAMVALDPETTRRIDRLAELQTQYDQMVATEEAPDIGALLKEGRQLQRALQTTAAKARTQPEVAARAEAFAETLERRFRQVDPEAFQILARHEGWIEAVWAALMVSP